MFRLFKRSPDTDPVPAEARCRADFRALCRQVHSTYLDAEEGRIERDAFLEAKVALLRAAVRDAEAKEAGDDLLRIMETLRLTCAVNDVELESVRSHFAG